MTPNEINYDELLSISSNLPPSRDGTYTKTSMFLLPMIRIDLRTVSIRKHFVNAFLNDVQLEHNFSRPIFVLMSTPSYSIQSWKDVDGLFRAMNEYMYEYYVGWENGRHLIMYVFEPLEKWRDDYYHFKAGRYSRFSEEYKSKFPQDIVNKEGKSEESIVWGAIHKSDTLKKRVEKEFGLDPGTLNKAEEIWDLPRKEREYFNFYKLETNGTDNQ